MTVETVAGQFAAINDRSDEIVPDNAFVQSALAMGQL